MAPRIVPGGRDSREHVFEFAKPPRQRYPSDLTDSTWQTLPPAHPTPLQRVGGRAPHGVGASRSPRSCRQPQRRHLTDAAPRWAPSPGRRPTSTSCAGPATVPGTVSSPRCTMGSAMAYGRDPEPVRGDRLLLDQSVTRSWSWRLRRRQEDRRHQRHVVVDTLACWWPCWSPRPACRIGRRCPGCSAEPATAAPGLGHLWADQGYTGSVVQAVSGILRFTIQIVGGIKPKGGFITQPRRWAVDRTFALDAPLPTPHPPVRADPHWPVRPWSSSASTRLGSAASTE
jgi:hypothetical protein